MQNIFQLLTGNPYPGRGILLGITPGGRVRMAYFIMGRSENSRNRVFIEKDGGIITQAHDPAKLEDPSLIIYAPVRVPDAQTIIVTNGDQTDTVFDALKAGGTFEAALRTRTYEPDPPNFTPRVSGLVRITGGRADFRLSILKAGANESALRCFYEYPEQQAGEGRFISTYETDGNPLPSFTGEPRPVALGAEEIGDFTSALWNALDADNRVSLFVRDIDPHTGETQTRIVNKHGDPV